MKIQIPQNSYELNQETRMVDVVLHMDMMHERNHMKNEKLNNYYKEFQKTKCTCEHGKVCRNCIKAEEGYFNE